MEYALLQGRQSIAGIRLREQRWVPRWPLLGCECYFRLHIKLEYSSRYCGRSGDSTTAFARITSESCDVPCSCFPPFFCFRLFCFLFFFGHPAHMEFLVLGSAPRSSCEPCQIPNPLGWPGIKCPSSDLLCSVVPVICCDLLCHSRKSSLQSHNPTFLCLLSAYLFVCLIQMP